MRRIVKLLAALVLQPAPGFAGPHDIFQRKTRVYSAPQRYLPPNSARGGRRLDAADTCEEIYAQVPMNPLRIGFDILGVEDVDPATIEYVASLMENASAYWNSVLRVRRPLTPITAEYVPDATVGDARYANLDSLDPLDLLMGKGWKAPVCGPERVPVPEKYLVPMKSCESYCKPQKDCSSCAGGVCACDAESWLADPENYCCKVGLGCDACPAGDFNSSNVLVRSRTGSDAYAVCMDECTEFPGGAGMVDTDLVLLVTIQDSPSCVSSQTLQAYASSCIADQCDRPIFASINFCKSRLQPNETYGVVSDLSTATHEIGHTLGFSSSLFPYFRDEKGRPRVPRDPTNARRFQHEKRFYCDAQGRMDWNQPGRSRFVDMVPEIVDYFDERGFSECGCPRNVTDPVDSSRCFVKKEVVYEVPSCSIKMVTPAVKQWARKHFDCPDLEGAELENQDTTECEFFGSHWEGRLFNGELMAAVHNEKSMSWVSDVTLALFVDSGWYDVNWENKDVLVPGVHWGYQQGCGFARDRRCVENGVPSWDAAFCTDPEADACSLDRLMTMKCSLSRTSVNPPAVFSYFGAEPLIGSSGSLDYCPVYGIPRSNRLCVSQASDTMYRPPSAQREVFGRTSRCFISDLHEFAYSELGIKTSPLCFDTKCADDGKSYQIGISDDKGGVEWLEPCTRKGREVRRLGFGGRVVCAHPDEICKRRVSMHLVGLSWHHLDAAMGVKLVEGYNKPAQDDNSSSSTHDTDYIKDAGNRGVPGALVWAPVVVLTMIAHQ